MKDTAFDIISLNDNAVLVEGKLYKKNEVVKTIHTDFEGIASTSADLLPYGNFRIVEKQAPNGYLTDGAKPIDFTITESVQAHTSVLLMFRLGSQARQRAKVMLW